MKQYIKKLPKEVLQPFKFVRDLVPDYYRYGKVFRNVYNELEACEKLANFQHEEYQLKQLQNLLKYSYENVNYYKKIFDERNLKPDDIKSFKDLTKLPYLTKDIIRENIDDLISKNCSEKDLLYLTTGGSSGTPLGFYEDKKVAKSREWAFTTHLWKRIGYDVRKCSRFVILRGHNVKKGISEYNGRNLILSSYHLSDENIGQYIALIEKFNPDFIQAYPSSIDILAKYLIENGKTIHANKLKGIICASEKLYDIQRINIIEAFKVRVFSFYGHTEHCCIAGECEKNNYYHIQSEYGVVELINDNNEQVKEENEKGEIVATNLNNYVMPFIRYKTGDIAINSLSNCSCGRNYRLIKGLEGRELEQIVTHSGAKVSLTALIFAQHFYAFSKIQTMQLEQMEKGKIIVKIVEQQILDQKDISEIVNKLKIATNDGLDVDIQIVRNIERTKRGKHNFLLQHLNLKNY
ncbi:hypothetical protein PH210_23685 [Paenibacillus sp. BSR1-1]|uniref:phenylacetate--CoA ligase family protein n=1 Tax=Paenibacillus sp. BSR1-1 TaxID=3020845 RepID=UPI0025AFAA45|nr:hypothetical protein [Paenibacillus sp. BSR1-1]MDN3019179.1 hypothetical protein [Paenibacillus sp. BSR1-1]